MASSSSSSPLLLFTLFLQYLFCSSHIVLPLTRSLSKTQFNQTHHLLKSASASSTKRFHNHQRQVSLPLSPGSDYTLSFSLGSKPAQTISLYLDTGSDLVWFPCAPFECILCEGKYEDATLSSNIPPKISASASEVPCSSPVCSAVHSSLPSSDLCAMSNCPLETIEISDCSSFSCPPFYYAYGDGSLIARLYQDKFSIPTTSSPSVQLTNFTFGCAHTALGEPIGVAGFGRGVLSLPAQLATLSPQLGNRFSYCLISHSLGKIHGPSPLILGRSPYPMKKQREFLNGEDEFLYTPMLDNPKHPYLYCVGLEGITVGKKRIEGSERLKRVTRAGNGGMVVDSGTTFTMLPTKLYEAVVTEFENRVGAVYERASDVEEQTGLRPCFYYNNNNNNNNSEPVLTAVPKMVLHLGGNVSVVLPRKNYWFSYDHEQTTLKKKRVGCLMLMDGGDGAGGGPAATLGNYQQQGFEVVYDLEKGRVGFERKQCSSLWDDLNRG